MEFTLLGNMKQVFDTYIQENKAIIPQTIQKEIQLFQSISKERSIILVGETHGTCMNEQIRFSLLQYFVTYANVKYYLIEAGYCDARLLNLYLETGDEKWINQLYSQYKETFMGGQESYNTWKKIYRFNKTLPEDKRIVVIGIDSVGTMKQSLMYLNELILKAGQPPRKIREIINGINVLYKRYCLEEVYKDFDNYRFWIRYMQSMNEDILDYKAYFQKDFKEFYRISKELITKIKRKLRPEKSKEIREQFLYESFCEIYEEGKKGNYLGQFGNAHVSNFYNSIESLAHRLNNKQDSPVRGCVTSICCLYDESKYLKPDHVEHKVRPIYVPTLLQEIFYGFFQEEVTVIQLNGNGTPFASANMKRLIGLEDMNSDHIQYYLLIKNSKEITPLSK